jgi:gliding motility-associated-like protein
MRYIRFLFLQSTLLAIWFLPISKLRAQCVLINEIMINGPGSCDGGCNPNTEEWTELYNDCSSPINIGCYVLTDGEFTVTIPSGTILAPYDYYVIGSNNSGGTVDLNLSTCNCTSGTLVGTFSNTNEQAILVNASGVIQDVVYWGGGDFPASISSTNVGACSPVNVNVLVPGGSATQLLSAGANGCSMARDCDGNPTWVQRCSSAVSINASNGSVIPKFLASDSTICPGTCISFTDLTTGNPTTWNWTFAGATPPTNLSSVKNPSNVCYNTPGNFPVTLSAITVCGSITVSMPAFINVTALPIPTITSIGSLNFCTGGSVILQSSVGASYQWYLNNVAIAGATQQQYTATLAGNYTVKITAGVCNATSVPSTVNVTPIPSTTVVPLGPTTICLGGSSILNAGAGFLSYQWLLNNAILAGETSSTLSVNSAGFYSVIVSNAGGCTDTSAQVEILFSTGYSATISANDTSICEAENAVLNLNSTFPNILWSTGDTSQQIVVSLEGFYSVFVSNSAGCVGYDTIFIEVTPLPKVNAGNDTIGDCINGIQLNGKGIGTLFLWSPASGLSNPNIANPIAKPDETTLYTLTITEKQCTSLDDVLVSVDCGSLYIPNSFSPNDDGNNDEFIAIGNGVASFEMQVFNRWGELVFKSNSISVGWDGKFLNLPAPMGVYVYEVKAIDSAGKPLTDGKSHGVLTLIR